MEVKKNIIDDLVYPELSYKIIGILFSVYIGYGYKEKYYERSVAEYFLRNKIKFKRQLPYKIKILGKIIGINYLDFLVEDKVILELKQGNYFSRQNIKQANSYLKITHLQLAILANFTPKGIQFKRLVNII